MLLMLTAHLMASTSQTTDELEPRFGPVIVSVNQAESAGATPGEVAELVTLLNNALELNKEALKLTSTSDAQKRAALSTQVDDILAQVETKAVQLQAVASQRTYTNTVFTYVSGAVAALLATVAYAYGVVFWRRYRIKRTFEMRISPK
jgi:hypothetical protein